MEYCRHLDNLGDHDHDDIMWKAIRVLDHKFQRHNPQDVHLKVKALWRNGGGAWVQSNALRFQDPYLLIRYAVERGIQHQEGWEWTSECAINGGSLEQLRIALKACGMKPGTSLGLKYHIRSNTRYS